MTKQIVTYLKFCYFHRKWQLACYVIILSAKSLEDGIAQHLTLIFAKSFKTTQLPHLFLVMETTTDLCIYNTVLL